jgi:ribose/xylose/arabinose/galactoside ABC-type transport system permease subunit
MIGGFALVLTGGNLISVLDNGHFTVLGRSDFETIKYSVWTLLAFTLLCGYLLSRTTYGRRVYASGGNPRPPAFRACASTSSRRRRLR